MQHATSWQSCCNKHVQRVLFLYLAATSMSMEEELNTWLLRPECTFREHLKFALKAWQSAELTLLSKYEVILNWFTAVADKQDVAEFPYEEFEHFLQLRTQPGAVAHQIKIEFIRAVLQVIKKLGSYEKLLTRRLPELLQLLLNFELLQDVFRSNYALQSETYALLLQLYEGYLREQTQLLPDHEATFFVQVMQALKDSVKRCSDLVAYDNFHTTYTLPALTQVLLVLQSHNLDYSSDFNELEQQLYEALDQKSLLQRIWKLPLHVRLRSLDSALYNRLDEVEFLKALLHKCFPFKICTETSVELLSIASYTLELLRRYDIKLNLKIPIQDDTTVLKFLGERIINYVTVCKNTNLAGLLQVLCATLRYNPLILQDCVSDLTVKMMLAEKVLDSTETLLYNEYLLLLLDMYRRLSRTEKFVAHLLKAVNNACKDVIEETCEKHEKLTLSSNFYIQLLFKNIDTTVKRNFENVAYNDFPYLASQWPYGIAGQAFSALIAGLVTKAGLSVWKTLLYALKELLETLTTNNEMLSAQQLFQLDLHAALLCQYYNGARLVEHWHLYHEQINELREFSCTVLRQFGCFLLAREHESRVMSAFLTCCYHAEYSELWLNYYRPDGIATDFKQPNDSKLQTLLTSQEWTLLQQRVLNFGDQTCKSLLERVQLQRNLSQNLLKNIENNDFSTIFSSDLEPKTLLLSLGESNAAALVEHMPRAEKLQIILLLWEHQRFDLLTIFANNLEAFNLIALVMHEKLHCSFVAKLADSSSLYVAALPRELSLANFDEADVDAELTHTVTAFENSPQTYSLERIPKRTVQNLLTVQKDLQFQYLRTNMKMLIFAWQVALYADLKAANADKLAAEVFETLTEFLRFDTQMQLFKHFSLDVLLRLLPLDDCWPLYELLFANIRHEDENTLEFIRKFTQLLHKAQKSDVLNDTQERLMVLAIQRMTAIRGLGAKKLRKQFEGVLQVFGEHVEQFFDKNEQKENSKKTKKFVEKTLGAIGPYTQALLQKQLEDKQNQQNEETKENINDGKKFKKSQKRKHDAQTTLSESPKIIVDVKFQRICKIYLAHSLDYRNPHAISLMQLAVNAQQQLQLSKNEIEFVLNTYWRQLREDLKTNSQCSMETLDAVVKLIIGNMPNEDLLLTLRDLQQYATAPEKYCVVVMKLLTLIGKCTFSKIKGAIFNEQFKQISCALIMNMSKDENQHFSNFEFVRPILNAQLCLVENKTIPITPDALDNMLTLFIDIDIKNFKITDTTSVAFFALHTEMVNLCMALIKFRHLLLMSRVSQLIHIFKDLMESLIDFKSDREKDAALTSTDLENLMESTHKLEILMNLMVQHKTHIKRIVPLLLIYLINLMVKNERPTTLYPQIKSHVDNVCLSLIGICDHKSVRFIMRVSNEASRQAYETLVKEHAKFHKFKGNV